MIRPKRSLHKGTSVSVQRGFRPAVMYVSKKEHDRTVQLNRYGPSQVDEKEAEVILVFLPSPVKSFANSDNFKMTALSVDSV